MAPLEDTDFKSNNISLLQFSRFKITYNGKHIM